MAEQQKLYIIIPCFNEIENLAPLCEALDKEIEKIKGPYIANILFVDDGSKDGTDEKIKEITAKNKNYHFIRFTRNFSHQNALLAGIHEVNADIIITMDADLQQSPEYIHTFLEYYEKGYQVVNAKRKLSKFSIKYLVSKLFYKFINAISDIKIEAESPDFRLYGPKIIKEIKSYNEKDLFLRGYVSWLGFSNISFIYDQKKRIHGKSSYNLSKMIALAVNGITSMTAKPLKWISVFGILLTLLPLAYSIYVVIVKIINPESIVTGWLSIVMLLTFFQGITFLFLGIIASYLSQIYNETKNRPNYIIQEKDIN